MAHTERQVERPARSSRQRPCTNGKRVGQAASSFGRAGAEGKPVASTGPDRRAESAAEKRSAGRRKRNNRDAMLASNSRALPGVFAAPSRSTISPASSPGKAAFASSTCHAHRQPFLGPRNRWSQPPPPKHSAGLVPRPTFHTINRPAKQGVSPARKRCKKESSERENRPHLQPPLRLRPFARIKHPRTGSA